jgi:hypothetical protein
VKNRQAKLSICGRTGNVFPGTFLVVHEVQGSSILISHKFKAGTFTSFASFSLFEVNLQINNLHQRNPSLSAAIARRESRRGFLVAVVSLRLMSFIFTSAHRLQNLVLAAFTAVHPFVATQFTSLYKGQTKVNLAPLNIKRHTLVVIFLV